MSRSIILFTNLEAVMAVTYLIVAIAFMLVAYFGNMFTHASLRYSKNELLRTYPFMLSYVLIIVSILTFITQAAS